VRKHATLLTSSNISIVNDTGAFRSFSTIWSAVVLQVQLSQIHLRIDSTTTALTFHSINSESLYPGSTENQVYLMTLQLSPPTIPHIASSHSLSPHKQVLSLAKFLTLLADEKPAGRRLSCISHFCLLGSWYSIFDIPLPSPVNRYEYKLKVWSKLDRKLLTLWKHQGPFWLHIVISYWPPNDGRNCWVVGMSWNSAEFSTLKNFLGRPKITTWSCALGQTTDWCQWWCLAISAR